MYSYTITKKQLEQLIATMNQKHVDKLRIDDSGTFLTFLYPVSNLGWQCIETLCNMDGKS